MMSTRSRALATALAAATAFSVTACSPGSGNTDEGDTSAGGGGGESAAAASECTDVEMRLSHQWPQAADDSGDFRAIVAQRFAEEVETATDGKVKYTSLLPDGQSPSDAVFAEKRREDMIRELTGWRCIRVVWSDLYVPEQTAMRIRRLFDGGARRA